MAARTSRVRKSSVPTQEVVAAPSGVTEAVSAQEPVTIPVTSEPAVTTQEAVGDGSLDGAGTVSTHEPVTEVVTNQPDAGAGQDVVTNVVTEESPRAAEPVTKVVTEPVSKGLVGNLIAELLSAPAEEVEALRRILASPPAVQLPERRKVRRRTYAYYLPEELGEAIAERARQEGVPPSTMAERLLWQAKAAGWL